MRHHRHATTLTSWVGWAAGLSLALLSASCSEGGAGGNDLQIKCPSGQTAEIQCVAPSQTVQGAKLPASFDQNRCQVRGEVKNSCCRPALAGPTLKEGLCCYAFCAGSCC